MLNAIIETDAIKDHMPDYRFELDGGIATVTPKAEFLEAYASPALRLSFFLKDETYEKAREIAPRWDIRVIEQEWRNWMKEAPKNPDAAFLGFCKKWFESRGAA